MVIVVDAVGNVLLTRRAASMRTYPGCWVLPGGGVDAGEPLAAVEARLDAEEQDTGINVTEDVKARNLKMGVWSDELIKFYQVREFFLFCGWWW